MPVQFDDAIAAFEKAEMNDDVIAILASGNIGDCQVELGDFDAAKSAFDKAISGATSSLAEAVLATHVHVTKSLWLKSNSATMMRRKADLTNIVSEYPQEPTKKWC
jgi:tetratricopeptide (TPR) repeat protein